MNTIKQLFSIAALTFVLSSASHAQNLFVVNQAQNGGGAYVTEFDPNGNLLGVVATNTGAQGIVFDKAGNFYIASGAGDGKVAKYAANGTLINASYIATPDPFGFSNPNPFGLAFDGSGNLFVTILRDSIVIAGVGSFPGHGFVQKYDANGNLITSEFAFQTQTSAFAVASSATNLYVSDLYGSHLFEYASDGTQVAQQVSTPGNPNALAVDQNGYVYVAIPSQGVVAKYDANLNSISNFVSGLNNPYGVAFDNQGDLYVSDLYTNRIYKYDPNGNLLHTITNSLLNRPGFMALQITPAPVLGITTISNAPVVLWPASATNYVLETTTNLALTNWATVSNGVPFVGVWVTNAPPDSFFRLKQISN